VSKWEKYGPSEVGQMRAKEACRPDYEGMIKRENKKELLLSALYLAVQDVVFAKDISFHNFNRSELRDLLGTVHVQQLETEMVIDSIISEQEKDGNKGA